VRALDVGAREQLVDVRADDVLDEGEGEPIASHRFGNADESRQHVGDLDARELRPVAVPDDDREVLAQVRDEREGMPRVERQWREHRTDLAREIRAQELADLRAPVGRFEQPDPFRREQRPQIVPHCGQVGEHALCARAHRLELLLGVVPVRSDVLDPLAQLLERGRHANHEELVEVCRRDREKLHTLEQRMCGIAALRQHAPVEFQPAQFTIDVERRVLQVGGIERPRRNDAQR
jgi:uncharacterized protein YifE (UPF0438 family)